MGTRASPHSEIEHPWICKYHSNNDTNTHTNTHTNTKVAIRRIREFSPTSPHVSQRLYANKAIRLHRGTRPSTLRFGLLLVDKSFPHTRIKDLFRQSVIRRSSSLALAHKLSFGKRGNFSLVYITENASFYIEHTWICQNICASFNSSTGLHAYFVVHD